MFARVSLVEAVVELGRNVGSGLDSDLLRYPVAGVEVVCRGCFGILLVNHPILSLWWVWVWRTLAV